MQDDFTKYEAMRNSRATSEHVYQSALQDGLDANTRIRMIRAVYSLSLGQAKEVINRAEGQTTKIDDQQSKIADILPSSGFNPPYKLPMR